MAGTAPARSRQSSKRGQQGVEKRALSASICAVAGLLFPKNRWDQWPETNGPPFLLYLLCLFLKSVISFEAFEPSLFQRVWPPLSFLNDIYYSVLLYMIIYYYILLYIIIYYYILLYISIYYYILSFIIIYYYILCYIILYYTILYYIIL